MIKKNQKRVISLHCAAMEPVRMQYCWALEFPYSNVCSTIGPDNFLVKKDYPLKDLCIIYLWYVSTRVVVVVYSSDHVLCLFLFFYLVFFFLLSKGQKFINVSLTFNLKRKRHFEIRKIYKNIQYNQLYMAVYFWYLV